MLYIYIIPSSIPQRPGYASPVACPRSRARPCSARRSGGATAARPSLRRRRSGATRWTPREDDVEGAVKVPGVPRVPLGHGKKHQMVDING